MICILVLMAAVIGCGSEEAQETTTLTGMVTAIDGSVISLVEMSGSNGMDFQGGQRPQRPEGMEGFEGFDGSFPEGFEGRFPEGFDGNPPEGMEGFAPWGEGEMPSLPEGETMPQRPEGGARPEMPTGENGEMMELPTGEGGRPQPGFGGFDDQIETTQIDISNAHISLEIEGGKASGTLEDITPGSFVTITRNAEGEVTNVLVSSRFSGRGGKSFS